MKDTQMRGFGFIFISAFFFGTYGIWSKLMVGSFGEFSQAWTRGLLLIGLLIPFGLVMKSFKRIKIRDIKWFAIISLCAAANQAPYYFGFKNLSIGTATLLFYVSLTVGTYILGKVFFGEKLTLVKYASLVMSCIGLGIIYSFSLAPHQIPAALLTIISGLMGACAVVFSKKVSEKYGEVQIMTLQFAAMFVVNLVIGALLKEQIPPLSNTLVWSAQIGYTVAMLLSNAFVYVGFKHISEPSIGGLIGLFEVLFGVIFGIVLFHEGLKLSFILGSLIVLAAIAMPELKVILRKNS